MIGVEFEVIDSLCTEISAEQFQAVFTHILNSVEYLIEMPPITTEQLKPYCLIAFRVGSMSYFKNGY